MGLRINERKILRSDQNRERGEVSQRGGLSDCHSPSGHQPQLALQSVVHTKRGVRGRRRV